MKQKEEQHTVVLPVAVREYFDTDYAQRLMFPNVQLDTSRERALPST